MAGKKAASYLGVDKDQSGLESTFHPCAIPLTSTQGFLSVEETLGGTQHVSTSMAVQLERIKLRLGQS